MYIDEEIMVPEEPIYNAITKHVIDENGKKSTILFKYKDCNMEHVLYHADPDCDHEIQAQWSGIKCIKCNGWYCA